MSGKPVVHDVVVFHMFGNGCPDVGHMPLFVVAEFIEKGCGAVHRAGELVAGHTELFGRPLQHFISDLSVAKPVGHFASDLISSAIRRAEDSDYGHKPTSWA